MKHTIKKYLTILLLLGLGCKVTACSNETPFYDSEIPPHLKPGAGETPDVDYYPKDEGTTRLVSYNVGIFSKYTDSYQMIADMMTEARADLIGISELDSCTVRTMRVFQLQKFTELMGAQWHHSFFRAMAYQGGAYGDGIACREKPIRTFSVALPKGNGAEPRVMVVAEFEQYIFATTHLDHVSSRSQLEQVAQINQAIEREFAASKKPVFLGGDFNARPETATLIALKEKWTVLTPHGPNDFTYSSQKPNSCIDYILLWKGNGAKCEVIGSKIMNSFRKGDIRQASDHIPVMVDVKFLHEDKR